MERIGKEVARKLSQTGDGAGQKLAEVTAAWPDVVGEAIARNAWPLRVGRDGTLHVATTSATWAFELDRMRLEIAERLSNALGQHAPAGLRFRPGPIPEPGAEATIQEPETVAEPSLEVAREAASAAAAIGDPELRELVERAARASLRAAPPGDRSGRSFW
jgi:predicted nucleic acid-binding Zn ribbon protein